MHATSLITIAFSALAASASAASCDLATLVPLLVDARNDACQTASGVVFPPPPGSAPTDEQWKKTCSAEACTSLYADLLTATPSECAIGKYAALEDIVNKHRSACGLSLSDSTASSNSTQSNSTQSVSTVVSSSSGSLDRESVVSQDLITSPPTKTTSAPPMTNGVASTTTSGTDKPKRNSTMAVEALTNSASRAPAASTLAVAASAVVAAIATFVL